AVVVSKSTPCKTIQINYGNFDNDYYLPESIEFPDGTKIEVEEYKRTDPSDADSPIR
ncbi:MAG: hypothetical protein GY710_04015, partial [Desulfobacteraceae bacterium]|nr:hypothetical protein [Desulfobacteraceae bacterium]